MIKDIIIHCGEAEREVVRSSNVKLIFFSMTDTSGCKLSLGSDTIERQNASSGVMVPCRTNRIQTSA